MNKKSAIEAVKAVMPNLSMREAETAVNTTLQSIANGLERDGEVTLTNFGTFKVKDVPARQGVNPQTGEKITIAAHKKIAFKPFKNVLEKISK